MPTLDQENEKKEQLYKVLKELSNIKAEDLIRAEKLGEELCFQAGVPYFRRILKLYKDLLDSNLDTVPYEVINSIYQKANELNNKINEIRTFSPSTTNTPSATRDAIINYFQNGYYQHFQTVSPVISYSIRKGTDFEALEKRAKDTVIHTEAVAEEIIKGLKETAASAESTLEQIRTTAAEAGVANHNIHFKKEYESQYKQSIKWLFATVFVGILTLGWGLCGIFYHPMLNEHPSTLEIIQSFTSKLIVLSVLYYLLVWCSKNFNANRHNYVINKHRYNALNTFQAFTKAAEGDPDIKNAVLLQTTQSIFNQQASGYIYKEVEQDSSKIIEILRSVGTTSKHA